MIQKKGFVNAIVEKAFVSKMLKKYKKNQFVTLLSLNLMLKSTLSLSKDIKTVLKIMLKIKLT